MFGVPNRAVVLMLNVVPGIFAPVGVHTEGLSPLAGQVCAALRLRDAGQLPAVHEASHQFIVSHKGAQVVRNCGVGDLADDWWIARHNLIQVERIQEWD